MERYYEVLRYINARKPSKEETRQILRNEAPELEEPVMTLREQRRWNLIGMILIPLLITLLGMHSSVDKPSVNEVERVIEQKINDVLNR